MCIRDRAAEARPVRVADVEAWPGHIACDGDSRSEVVVPVIKHGVVSHSETASLAVAVV